MHTLGITHFKGLGAIYFVLNINNSLMNCIITATTSINNNNGYNLNNNCNNTIITLTTGVDPATHDNL